MAITIDEHYLSQTASFFMVMNRTSSGIIAAFFQI